MFHGPISPPSPSFFLFPDHHKMIDNSDAGSKDLLSSDGQGMNPRLWSSSLKNPRIVRVSKLFGGKDRHSKVSTIRGLRDRRVRLSVPTAIQLYDLQDRLGLSQPSKVVDWLLNAAREEVDKLPPLPIPHDTYSSHESHPSIDFLNGKKNHPHANNQVLAPHHGNLRIDDPSISGLLNNSVPYASYYNWDPSNAYPDPSSNPIQGSQMVYCPMGAEKQQDQFHLSTGPGQDNLPLHYLQISSQSVSPSMRLFQSNWPPLHQGGR